MNDPYAKWRAMLAGEKPQIYEDEPICGYFRMRDRRGLNLHKAANKRPIIAAAIWFENGEPRAAFGKEAVPVERIWPWCAKNPISYEDYAYWCQHERWPEQESA